MVLRVNFQLSVSVSVLASIEKNNLVQPREKVIRGFTGQL